jgi:hypothetical protein
MIVLIEQGELPLSAPAPGNLPNSNWVSCPPSRLSELTEVGSSVVEIVLCGAALIANIQINVPVQTG